MVHQAQLILEVAVLGPGESCPTYYMQHGDPSTTNLSLEVAVQGRGESCPTSYMQHGTPNRMQYC
jgi:hypothetical protein